MVNSTPSLGEAAREVNWGSDVAAINSIITREDGSELEGLLIVRMTPGTADLGGPMEHCTRYMEQALIGIAKQQGESAPPKKGKKG